MRRSPTEYPLPACLTLPVLSPSLSLLVGSLSLLMISLSLLMGAGVCSGVGGAVGDFVGELVAVQLVVLVPSSTKPSRHWQWKSSPLLTHWVEVESHP